MKKTGVICLVVLLVSSFVWAVDRPAINGPEDEINYSVGHQVGRDLVRQQVKVNSELLLQGILDATNGTDPLLTPEKMVEVLANFKDRIVKLAQEKKTAVKHFGEVFLKENAKKKGVTSLENGMQYKILTPGTGEFPAETDRVRVSYTGTDIYGNQFDSSIKDGKDTPVEFKVADVIPGWMEALTRMREGAEWEIYLPFYLAFKDAGPLAGQTVIYRIKLLNVNP